MGTKQADLSHTPASLRVLRGFTKSYVVEACPSVKARHLDTIEAGGVIPDESHAALARFYDVTEDFLRKCAENVR